MTDWSLIEAGDPGAVPEKYARSSEISFARFAVSRDPEASHRSSIRDGTVAGSSLGAWGSSWITK
ncbi:MAG: hypothetical protein BWX80_01375 [Candidatus Hydrogenedentes bacterium ADurb.Bin101]|nr:MAG: hypothetical protein BWX80_01375 [Candidatus Hydrogenedentes bacterium ADurb.Bin101]